MFVKGFGGGEGVCVPSPISLGGRGKRKWSFFSTPRIRPLFDVCRNLQPGPVTAVA